MATASRLTTSYWTAWTIIRSPTILSATRLASMRSRSSTRSLKTRRLNSETSWAASSASASNPGTNQFHGNAFEFFRNDVLNANEWSNKFNGAPRPKLRWNEFGATFGGPIHTRQAVFLCRLPRSTFRYADQHSATVFADSARTAGKLLAATLRTKPVQLYNPFSVDANGKRAPFPGNIIPASLLSPAALKIVTSQYYPTPTGSGLNNNDLYSTHTALNGDQGDAKIDWNRSEKDRIFGRYSQSNVDNPSYKQLAPAIQQLCGVPDPQRCAGLDQDGIAQRCQ